MQVVSVGKEVTETSKLRNGHPVVGIAAVKITPQDLRFMRGFMLRAPGASDPVPNTHPIWIGNASVTANSAVDSGGFPIIPGGTVMVPTDDTSELYAISTAGAQDLAWIGV